MTASAEDFIAGIDTQNAPMCATDALKARDLAIRLEVVERLRELLNPLWPPPQALVDAVNQLESEIRKAGES